MQSFLATVPSYILTCVVIEVTPGPNMAYLAIVSAVHGRRAGWAATAGIALGLLALGIAGAFGLAAIILQSSVVYEALRWCGVAYLLWLAWEGWSEADGASHEIAAQAAGNVAFFRRG